MTDKSIQEKKVTVGELAFKAAQEKPEDPKETREAFFKDYMEKFQLAVEAGKRNFKSDFFVEVTSRLLPLAQNVLYCQHFPLIACPTPNYDQAVYHYHYDIGRCTLVWQIPSPETAQDLVDYALDLTDPEKELLMFVLDYRSGALLKKAKQLNKEEQLANGAIGAVIKPEMPLA